MRLLSDLSLHGEIEPLPYCVPRDVGRQLQILKGKGKAFFSVFCYDSSAMSQDNWMKD